MNRAEKRSQKRKEVVEAVVIRNEPVVLVARIFNASQRTLFDWLARYRQAVGTPLKKKVGSVV